jgi:transcriptional antiterminator NusG
VQTGEEHKACEFLNKLFDKEESVAFVPQVEIVIKNSQSIRKELRPMFPGYVFTDSILNERVFVNLAYEYARFSKCVFYLLGDKNINYVKLSEDEKKFLLVFCNDEYIVEDSKGFILGDKVFVTSGPLRGKESVIRKINRHKRRAEIELIWFGQIRHVCVALEIMSKSN